MSDGFLPRARLQCITVSHLKCHMILLDIVFVTLVLNAGTAVSAAVKTLFGTTSAETELTVAGD